MADDADLMEFEDILEEVGGYGPYQKRLVFLLLVPSLCLTPFFSMNIFFMLSVPDHWCFIPEIASSNLSIHQQKLFSPQTDPSCLMHDINYTEYLNSTSSFSIFNNSQTLPCVHGWQYDKSQYEYTAASQWNLVCSDGHYVSFVIMVQYIGSIIGNPFNGFLSDRFGRKIVFVCILLLAAATEVASVIVKDFMVFTVIRGINGVVFPAIYQLPFVTLLEIVSPEKRAFINGVQSCCWTFGLCLLPAVAYLSRSWVTLSLITASMTVFLLFCWSFIPESPRWLVSRGRCEEAFGIMKKIAKKNEKTLNPSILLTKLQALDEKCKEEKLKGLKHSATDILRVPHMRKLFAFISICWTASFLAYEGLQLNVYNLTGNEFLNFFLLAVMEVPGNLASWLLMERFGRRFTLIISFILTGLVCVLAVIEYPYSDVAISIVGKFLSAITSMATYQRSSELFPTVVRCLGLSMCSMVATIITLCIPYIVYLGVYGKSIPFLTIGICCLLAGVLSAFLPETLNKNLPQTINDAKEFGKDQKFFSFNRQKPQDRTDRQIPVLLSERKTGNCMSDEENSLLDCSLQKGKIIILPRSVEHENEDNEKNNKFLSRNKNSLEEENNAINESLANGLP